MVCVEGNYNEGTCNVNLSLTLLIRVMNAFFKGDNGSPLVELYMYRYYLMVGIASFISGNGCESTDPSGYTRTFPYNEWIRNVTRQ
jgi:hypothetical protein